MKITPTLIARLAHEAHSAASGLQIRAIVDAVGGGHLLLLASDDVTPISARLLIQTATTRGRLHLSPAHKPPQPRPVETHFNRMMSQKLKGGVIDSIRARDGERLVELEATLPGTQSSDESPWRLVAELFGATPILALVDPDGVVRLANQRRRGRRPIEIGVPYQFPPSQPHAIPPAEGEAGDEANDVVDLSVAAGPFADAHPWSAAADAFFRPIDETQQRTDQRHAAQSRVSRELDKVTRLIEQLNEQRLAGEEAVKLRHHGDLLAANFHRLRGGLAQIDVEDYETGEPVTIALDPALPPQRNVDRLYRRARKQSRSAEGAITRLDEAERRRATLSSLLASIVAVGDSPLPEALVEEMTHLTAPKPPPAAPRELRKIDDEQRKGIRTIQPRSGVLILVGKTNRDNDFLTTRVANGNDLWMHLQGGAGSHVVLRLPKGKQPTPLDLADAALLALHFSKRRGAPHADVMYTPRKYVRKPKGAPLGAVTVDRFKTYHVAYDRARIDELLASSTG